MLTYDDLKEAQQLAVDRLYSTNATLLVAPKGFGKCVVGFTAINELLHDGIVKNVLVLSTSQVCNQVWAKETQKWAHLPDDNYVVLSGESPEKRHDLMDRETPIVICNFEILPWLYDNYPDDTFDALLVDEITKLKAVGTKAVKKLRGAISKHLKWNVGMTADPVAQESVEIYSQMLVIDKGERLGRNRDVFRRKYFMPVDFMQRKWTLQPGGLERLTAKLADVLYTVDSDDYLENIPEVIDHVIDVDMGQRARHHYNELAKTNVTTLGDVKVIAPNAAVLQGKLHQIACGAMYYLEDEFDERNKVAFMHGKKMDALIDLVDTIDTPVIVSYQFNFQRDALKHTFGAPVFSASNSKKVNDGLIKKWDNGELPMLLLHHKSGSHGLNLQNGPGHTLINLTYFWSRDAWEQLVGRLARQGQASKFVDRYTIVCRDTVEDLVMRPLLDSRGEASEMFHLYLSNVKIRI